MRRVAALFLLSSIACTSAGNGIAPPLDTIYFPTGLAVSKDTRFLYVVNSDFDLQYNAGTLQSLDLVRIRQLVPRGCRDDTDCGPTQYCDQPVDATDTTEHSYWCVDRAGDNAGTPCGSLGNRSESDRVSIPGRCEAVNLTQPPDGGGSLFIDAMEIGAFATDAIVRSAPSTAQFPERLFVPVRGESSVNWIDISAEGRFECGQGDTKGCDASHRAGRDASGNARALVLPPEPYAIDASNDGSSIVLTHQTQGAVSLLLNDWQLGPHLEYVYSGLPPMPVAVKAVPDPEVVTSGTYKRSPGFLVAYETTARLDLFRYAPDALSAPARPYLELAASAGVTINSGGYDVRGIAIDDSARLDCEASARSSNTACTLGCASLSGTELDACQTKCDESGNSDMLKCASVSLNIYASSRSPATLLVGHTSPDSAIAPNSDIPSFSGVISVPTGPSRVQITHIINENGEVETRVLVVCFDSRRIAVVDPMRGMIESLITTGRGPQAIVEDFAAPSLTDEGHARAIIGHFTDSYLGVVELDRRRGRSYGTIVLSLGSATAPRTSK